MDTLVYTNLYPLVKVSIQFLEEKNHFGAAT